MGAFSIHLGALYKGFSYGVSPCIYRKKFLDIKERNVSEQKQKKSNYNRKLRTYLSGEVCFLKESFQVKKHPSAIFVKNACFRLYFLKIIDRLVQVHSKF